MQKIDRLNKDEDQDKDAPKSKSGYWKLFGGFFKHKPAPNADFADVDGEEDSGLMGKIDVVVKVFKSFLEQWPSPKKSSDSRS